MKIQNILTIIFLVSTLFFAYKFYVESETNKNLTASKNFQFEWNPSGDVLFSKWSSNNELSNAYIDKNYDYNYEVINTYDIYGNLSETSFDYNENGVFEKSECFDAYGKKIATSFDKNEDGVPDEMTISLENSYQLYLIDSNHDGIWDGLAIGNDTMKTKTKIYVEDLLK